MKLIILDRDGVINYDSDQFIKSPGQPTGSPPKAETPLPPPPANPLPATLPPVFTPPVLPVTPPVSAIPAGLTVYAPGARILMPPKDAKKGPFMKGTDVLVAQQSLLAHGFNPGKMDGIYGPASVAQVVLFQKAKKLLVLVVFHHSGEAEGPGAAGRCAAEGRAWLRLHG